MLGQMSDVVHLGARHEAPQDIDLIAAEDAARRLLVALGADVQDESLRETPRRVAHSLAEMLTPQPFEATTFPNDEGYDELVIARSIPFHSLCEHHVLPFFGKANVAYIPNNRIVGLSKLPRIVDVYARRLQVQERMTEQIAQALTDILEPRGVGVVIEALHLCMMMRGVQKQNSKTITSAVRGAFRDDYKTRDEFLRLAHSNGG